MKQALFLLLLALLIGFIGTALIEGLIRVGKAVFTP